MTAIDEYLARERETLRAATPRSIVFHVATCPAVGGAVCTCGHTEIPAYAKLVVSMRSDREALLDAVELLARIEKEAVEEIAELQNPHEPPDPIPWMDMVAQDIRAVLSRLTADSEGVGT